MSRAPEQKGERGGSEAEGQDREDGQGPAGDMVQGGSGQVGMGWDGLGCSWLQNGSGSPLGSEQSRSRGPDLFSVAPCCRDGR